MLPILSTFSVGKSFCLENEEVKIVFRIMDGASLNYSTSYHFAILGHGYIGGCISAGVVNL